MPELPAEQLALRRSYSHGPMKTACSWVMDTKTPAGQKIRTVLALARAETRMVRVAEAFVDLQERRHVG